jgi:SAM-dependent methyltransferase
MTVRDNRDYYDEFSNWYEKERHHGYHAMIDDLEVDLVLPLCRGRDVLEIGCGTGLLLTRVAAVAASAKGVDLSPGMLEGARRRGLDVVEGTATALPFEPESFDVVYSFKVLAHVEEIETALSEAARVLRPGGRAVLEFYNRHSLRFLAKRIGGAGKISASTDESQVFTRWDALGELLTILPGEFELERIAGVRVFTPAAFIHRVPGLRRVVRKAEFLARDAPLLRRWGGFLVLVLRRRDSLG